MQDQTGKIYDDSKAILLGENWSIFFGLPMSSSGHGIRDNAGVIEVKNRGGAWASPLSEAALQLGTMSATIALHTLQIGTLSTSVTGLLLQVGTISGTVGLNTLAIGTNSTSITAMQIQNIPFDAANFTANTGTWSVTAGNLGYLEYMIIGNSMLVNIALNNTSLSATTSQIFMAIPDGKTAGNGFTIPGIATLNSVVTPFFIYCGTGSTVFGLVLNTGNWPPLNGLVSVNAQFWLKIL